MSRKIDRTGETNVSNEGCAMKIVEYNSTLDIVIEFQDEHKYRLHAQYKDFKNGQCKNPFYPSVYGYGYLGTDKEDNIPKAHESKDGKSVATWEYLKWQSMLQRCFDNKLKEKEPTYKDVTCCKRWLCFSYFLEDLEILKQEYNWSEDIKLNLDKDILHKGNKIYSLENCVLVPQWINSLFTKNDTKRGKYLIGVCYNKQCKKYQAFCNINRKLKGLGLYNTPEEAFNAYKIAKENEIKRVAEDCVLKGYITKDGRLYNVMMGYQIKIDD
ncbi:MAG: hypothetical protein SPI06_09945 [Terrisporobacter sp.]|uniref:hypothetical protein n=1 Tax=Terrisporobacter sp. TaxID=1965305 RepID=UPI002A90D987|nr:hypothetical protein [Terrisporobacter sp.]MDY6153727.1 hypothetical protein [Terrisporobacter sp.]